MSKYNYSGNCYEQPQPKEMIIMNHPNMDNDDHIVQQKPAGAKLSLRKGKAAKYE